MENEAPKLRFRLAQNTDRDAAAFCALSNSLYNRPVNEDYYRWQFFSCPFPSLLNVAVDEDDVIVGTYCLHVQGDFAWVLDIMVSPKFQRRGVFRQLVDFGYENLKSYNAKAILVMANENADRATVQGLGWTRINTFFTYFAEPRSFDSDFILEYRPISDFSVCSAVNPPTELISNPRTSSYQEWRFLENARYEYDTFAAYHQGQPFGYVVLKIFRDTTSGRSFGDIVDLVWNKNDDALLKDMLSFSLDHFHKQNVNEAAMWLQTNTLLDRVGTESGFARSGQQRFFCGKALQQESKAIEEHGNWFINMADSEVY